MISEGESAVETEDRVRLLAQLPNVESLTCNCGESTHPHQS